MKKAVLLCAALAITAPHLAHAQGAPVPAERSKQAQGLADQGYEAYQHNDWARAIALYVESYKLVPTSETLFNIASIYDRKLNDKALAIEYYRRHNAAPDATSDLIAKATTRISDLSREDRPAPSAAPAPVQAEKATPADKPSDGSGLRVTGLVAAGLGLVGVGVGVGFGLTAHSRHESAISGGCSGKTCPDTSSADMERGAASAGTVSTVGFVAGGVLLATGVTLYIVGRPSSSEAKASASVRVTPSAAPGAAGLMISGAFF